MARLLVDATWFEAVPSHALFEAEYTRILLQSSAALFPTFHLVRFSPILTHENIGKIPDLALIDHRYRDWWVVEVERSDHRLYEHVIPQVEVFARAKYGSDEADVLMRSAPELDSDSVREMMRGQQPRVMVISDAGSEEWRNAISRHNGILTIVEMFRSATNRHVLRLNGEYPSIPRDILSVCRIDPLLPRLVIVESPASIRDFEGQTPIEFKGEVSYWTKIGAQDRVWLSPARASPFDSSTRPFVLVRTDDGRIRFDLEVSGFPRKR